MALAIPAVLFLFHFHFPTRCSGVFETFLDVSLLTAYQTFFADRSPIPETSGKVRQVNDLAELDAVLSTTTYVVADFYADWCGPCRAIAPVFSELAAQHSRDGHLAFVRVNVDHANAIAQRYGVSAMPTFLFFHKGAADGVKVEGLESRRTIKFTDNGLVERVMGADRVALEGIIRALAEQENGK